MKLPFLSSSSSNVLWENNAKYVTDFSQRHSVLHIKEHTHKKKKGSEMNLDVCFLEEGEEVVQMLDRICRFHGFISTLTHGSHMLICLIWDLLGGGYIFVSLPARWFDEISAHHFSASLLSVKLC